ncbi:hypothetical protein OUZ56_000520 [Daphnia magna]|uniref:Uncharacterized protein n=1 Tax=Daphnia magna TaxID=35525 RepID=A0ABQ9ZZX7_9CRUS|nr:hypothetical protein OUZ56_000520 [Daphnia magna]
MGAIFFHLVEMPQGEPEPFLVFLVWGFNFVKGLEDPNKSRHFVFHTDSRSLEVELKINDSCLRPQAPPASTRKNNNKLWQSSFYLLLHGEMEKI